MGQTKVHMMVGVMHPKKVGKEGFLGGSKLDEVTVGAMQTMRRTE
jgi:hypothetical protein